MVMPSLARSKAVDKVPSTILIKQWRHIYEAGKSQNPPVAASSSAAFLYLAWAVRQRSTNPQLPLYYGTAAALTLAIVPFTLLIMAPTNNKLIQHSTRELDDTKSDDVEIDQLMSQWSTMNAFRSLLPLTGGLMALVVSLA